MTDHSYITLEELRPGAIIKFITHPMFYRNRDSGCELSYIKEHLTILKMLKSDVGIVSNITVEEDSGKDIAILYHISYYPSTCGLIQGTTLNTGRPVVVAQLSVRWEGTTEALLETSVNFLTSLKVNTVFGEQSKGLFNNFVYKDFPSEDEGIVLWGE